MPEAAINGVTLWYDVTGEGFPIVFSHEFAGDGRSWDPQVRAFDRLYRCITYNHRGYPPSSVPEDPAAYSQELLVEDLRGLFRHLGLDRAHLVGFSMGASVALVFALRYPELCRSVVLAGIGTGTTERARFEQDVHGIVALLRERGMQQFAEAYALSPARLPFKRKDPRGWAEFRRQLAEHSALGSALTMQGVQLRRPTIYDLKDQLPGLRVPTLVIAGDEDEPCVDPSVFLKRSIPACGLAMLPQTGHTVNLEEPALFNRVVLDFFRLVEAERWAAREAVTTSLLPEERH